MYVFVCTASGQGWRGGVWLLPLSPALFFNIYITRTKMWQEEGVGEKEKRWWWWLPVAEK